MSIEEYSILHSWPFCIVDPNRISNLYNTHYETHLREFFSFELLHLSPLIKWVCRLSMLFSKLTVEAILFG